MQFLIHGTAIFLGAEKREGVWRESYFFLMIGVVTVATSLCHSFLAPVLSIVTRNPAYA